MLSLVLLLLLQLLSLFLVILLLLHDLPVISFLEEGILPLRAKQVLTRRLVELGVLVLLLFVRAVHRHLVGIVASHRRIHLHVHLDVVVALVVELPPLDELVLHPRLPERGDKDTAAPSAFLVYTKDNQEVK